MAEAVAAAAGITLLKAAVSALVSELVTETTSLVWNRNNNCKSLGRMLGQLEPIVGSIPSTSTETVVAWLGVLRKRLESVKDVLQESSRRRSHLDIKQFSISKKLVQEIKQLNETLTVAPVVVLSIAASADVVGLNERCKEISGQLEGLQNELQRQHLAQTTRMALETPTNSFGNSIDLMTANRAYLSIKEEADSILLTTSMPLLPEARSEHVSTPRPTHRRLDSETMFGGDEVVEEAKMRLLSDENSHKVGLWASGGTGKTHAALRVFNDETIQAHFTGGCFLLTVGRALSLETLLRNLRYEITGLLDVRRNISVADLMNQLCTELRSKKNMFIVLDDVWEDDVLRSLLAVVPLKAGCKILVTTRNYEILDKNSVTKLQVPLLSDENSWTLFCWQAFRGVSHVPPELQELARGVSRECGGLPLALKVIGRVFVGKIDKGYWQHSLEKLRNADILDQNHEKQLYERLKLSVDELPAIDRNLKDCFFYFAAFPEARKVGVFEDLLPVWIGDRIVGNNSYDPKEEACELVGWLVSRSLIELHSDSVRSGICENFLFCTVHDVLRDLARYILQHKVAVAQRECLYEAGRDLDHFPQEWICAQGKSPSDGALSARRLSVMSSNLRELPAKLLDAPKLQVLLLRNNPFQMIPTTFFKNLQNIRVLDLRSTTITSLPKGIGILKLLIVLNVSYTPLVTLPDSLGNLTSLEQLALDRCNSLSHLPASFSSLTRLQVLTSDTSTDVWKDRGLLSSFFGRKFVLKELVSLVALKQLRITSGAQVALPADFFTALKKLRKLDLLRFGKLRQLPDLRPGDLNHLQVLNLTRCESLTSLPSSFDSLQRLEALILDGCRALLSLPALDGLPNLVKLYLTDCSGLESLPATFGRKDAFPALEELGMYGCDKVASFPELEDGAMPCLKFLDLAGWVQLETLPTSLASLKNLRFLGLSLCFNLKTLEHDHLRFTSLVNLEELVLDACRIPDLPASLELLPNFRVLRMRSCNASIPEQLEREISEGRVKLHR